MEGLALVAAEFAISDEPMVDMPKMFARANKAASWLNQQHTSTTARQMEYFKNRRHTLFRQWEIGYRGPARDAKGHFCPKQRPQKEIGVVISSPGALEKKSKLEAYGDIFAGYR